MYTEAHTLTHIHTSWHSGRLVVSNVVIVINFPDIFVTLAHLVMRKHTHIQIYKYILAQTKTRRCANKFIFIVDYIYVCMCVCVCIYHTLLTNWLHSLEPDAMRHEKHTAAPADAIMYLCICVYVDMFVFVYINFLCVSVCNSVCHTTARPG